MRSCEVTGAKVLPPTCTIWLVRPSWRGRQAPGRACSSKRPAPGTPPCALPSSPPSAPLRSSTCAPGQRVGGMRTAAPALQQDAAHQQVWQPAQRFRLLLGFRVHAQRVSIRASMTAADRGCCCRSAAPRAKSAVARRWRPLIASAQISSPCRDPAAVVEVSIAVPPSVSWKETQSGGGARRPVWRAEPLGRLLAVLCRCGKGAQAEQKAGGPHIEDEPAVDGPPRCVPSPLCSKSAQWLPSGCPRAVTPVPVQPEPPRPALKARKRKQPKQPRRPSGTSRSPLQRPPRRGNVQCLQAAPPGAFTVNACRHRGPPRAKAPSLFASLFPSLPPSCRRGRAAQGRGRPAAGNLATSCVRPWWRWTAACWRGAGRCEARDPQLAHGPAVRPAEQSRARADPAHGHSTGRHHWHAAAHQQHQGRAQQARPASATCGGRQAGRPAVRRQPGRGVRLPCSGALAWLGARAEPLCRSAGMWAARR